MSLLDTASLIVTPNGYKEGKLYSVIPSDGSGDMSVVRATTATRVNSDGLVELVPYNLLTWSQDFSNANWVKSNGPTMTYNSAIAPDGTMTATGVQDTTGGSYKSVYQIKTNVSSNSTYTCSLYVKKEISEIAYGGISMYFSGGTVDAFYGIVNSVNGTVTITSSTITPTIQVISEGNYWRIICIATDTGSNTNLLFEYYPTISTNGTTLGQGIGSVRTIWGAQMVEGSNALTYQKTETRLNIPRLDYSNGTCPSLLVEPQRTNISNYIESGTGNWQAATVTSANSILGLKTFNVIADGVIFGDQPHINSNSEFQANSKYTCSFYTDFSQCTGISITCNLLGFFPTVAFASISINKTTKAITTQNVGGVWTIDSSSATQINGEIYRISFTATPSLTSIAGSRTYINGNLAGHFAGIQLEAGAYGTSFINKPTSASVTRNADQVYKTGISSLIGQTEGTIFLEADVQKHNASEFYIAISNGASLGEAIYLYQPSGGILQVLFRTGGVAPTISILNANWNIGYNKIAIAYNSTSGEVFMNGVSKGTVALSALPSCSKLTLGSRPDATGTLVGSGGYKVATLWKTRLTNTQLAQLTTI
jgi:hypothetical protein